MSALRIVLLGENEAEQRATGNAILGKEVFNQGFSTESVAGQSERHEGTVKDRKISVILSPRLLDSSVPEEDLKAGLDQCISLSAPGPHVFLLVIGPGRFIEDQHNTVKWIQENFGEDALKFTMAVFTGALHPPVKEYLKKHNALRKLVDKCKAGYHVFEDDSIDLLKKIDRAVKQNGGQHYSNDMYLRKVREEKKKRRESEREGKAELVIRKIGKIFVELLGVILKALMMKLCAIARSTLQGFGVGLIIIIALSLIGILTESWTSFVLKLLIFGTSGIIGAIIGLNSDTKIEG